MNKLFLLAAISFATIILGVAIGSVYIPLTYIVAIFFGRNSDPALQAIIMDIRLPRVLMAYVSGAGLSLGGVIMQSVLKNPLASSFTIGTSSGAAVGASIAIMLGTTIFGFFTVPIFGFIFAMFTVFTAIALAMKIDNLQNITIILIGMAISFFAGAALTIILALNADTMHRLVFWQFGSFASVGFMQVWFIMGVFILISTLVLFKHKEMDILTLDDTTATSIGLNVAANKWYLLFCSAVITGVIVSLSGIIGFVDLFTPHLARRFVGASHRFVIPMAAMIGGGFMVLCDMAARSIFAPVELPVGAITAAIGGPFFIYLYFYGRQHAGA